MKGKVYEELKYELKKNNKRKNNNIYKYILIAVILFFTYSYIHNSINWVQAKEQTINYIEIDWQATEVSDVKIMQIPQKVYKSMEDLDSSSDYYKNINIDKSRDQYLTWDKKHVLLITRDWCPYARSFHKELNKIFENNYNLQFSYTKDIRTTWQKYSISCINENCPAIRLNNYCSEWICIINPNTKELIIDTSQNSKQILPLLKAYDKRNNTPLIK